MPIETLTSGLRNFIELNGALGTKEKWFCIFHNFMYLQFPEDVKMWIIEQQVWGRTWESAFLNSVHDRSVLLVWEEHALSMTQVQ